MKTLHILVVDDEDDVRKAWAKFLRLRGHEVIEATGAADALVKASEHALDIALLDFIMPEMDGVELLAKLRKTQPFLRSLIISGQIDRDLEPSEITKTLNEAVEADEYLHKPVGGADLEAAIERVMAKNDGAEEDWPTLAARASRASKSRLGPIRAVAKNLKKKKRRNTK